MLNRPPVSTWVLAPSQKNKCLFFAFFFFYSFLFCLSEIGCLMFSRVRADSLPLVFLLKEGVRLVLLHRFVTEKEVK